jgi:hypothetical protein
MAGDVANDVLLMTPIGTLCRSVAIIGSGIITAVTRVAVTVTIAVAIGRVAIRRIVAIGRVIAISWIAVSPGWSGNCSAN